MREHLVVRRLAEGDEAAFYEALREFEASGDFVFVSHFREGMPFAELLSLLEDQEGGRRLPKGHVPSTFLFGFVGEKLVGRVMIRHSLNDFLRAIGGHIGYGVVASERRQGYAGQLLQAALRYSDFLGLERVLVTCDEDNLASKKTIERAGGIFEDFTEQGQGLPKKRLYWIPILNE